MSANERSKRRTRQRFGPGRSTLLKARDARGHQCASLWYQYSARQRSDVVLLGNTQFEHFCWLEGSEQVSSYELQPSPLSYIQGGQVHLFSPHACVWLRSGVVQLHDVQSNDAYVASPLVSAAAQAAGFEYVLITPSALRPHRVLVANWKRGLAFLGACRELALDSACNEIASLCRTNLEVTLQGVLANFNAELQSFYVAAVLRCLQEGWLASDLSAHPLSLQTQLTTRDMTHA